MSEFNIANYGEIKENIKKGAERNIAWRTYQL